MGKVKPANKGKADLDHPAQWVRVKTRTKLKKIPIPNESRDRREKQKLGQVKRR